VARKLKNFGRGVFSPSRQISHLSPPKNGAALFGPKGEPVSALSSVDFQVLAAVRADLGVARVGAAAIETSSRGSEKRGLGRGCGAPLSLIPVRKVKGKKNDQDEEHADGPEKPLREGVSILLGVEEYPKGDDQRKHIKKDNKEAHSVFSPSSS